MLKPVVNFSQPLLPTSPAYRLPLNGVYVASAGYCFAMLLYSGSVITELNGQRISNIDDLES